MDRVVIVVEGEERNSSARPVRGSVAIRLSQSAQGQSKLFRRWNFGRRAEGVVQPTAQIPVGKQVHTQHRSEIGERPVSLGKMMHPFQQQDGDQRGPNLNEQRVPAGSHKGLQLSDSV